MRKILLFERRKATEQAPTEVTEGDHSAEVTADNQTNHGELWVEAGATDVADDLPETDIFENLGQLRRELKEFEKFRGGIRTTLSSIEKLVPRLNARKARLVKEMDAKRKGVAQLTQQIPQLKTQKEELLQSIQQKQEQKKLLEAEITERQAEVERLTGQIPQLKARETQLLTRIDHNQKALAQINDQITEVVSIQKYGIDFVSALVYASQKNKH